MLLGYQIVSRRVPARIIEQSEALMRYLVLVVRIGEVHNPNVVSAITVGGKCKKTAIGTVLRLHFPRMTTE